MHREQFRHFMHNSQNQHLISMNQKISQLIVINWFIQHCKVTLHNYNIHMTCSAPGNVRGLQENVLYINVEGGLLGR